MINYGYLPTATSIGSEIFGRKCHVISGSRINYPHHWINFSEKIVKQEEEDILERTNEHLPAEDGFSMDSERIFSFSISSLLNSEIERCGISSLLGWVLAMCACPLSLEFRLIVRGLPLSFQHCSLVWRCFLQLVQKRESLLKDLDGFAFLLVLSVGYEFFNSFSPAILVTKSRTISHSSLKHDALSSPQW